MTKLIAVTPIYSMQLNRIVPPGEEFDIEISPTDLDHLVAQGAVKVKEVKHGKDSTGGASNDDSRSKPDLLVSD